MFISNAIRMMMMLMMLMMMSSSTSILLPHLTLDLFVMSGRLKDRAEDGVGEPDVSQQFEGSDAGLRGVGLVDVIRGELAVLLVEVADGGAQRQPGAVGEEDGVVAGQEGVQLLAFTIERRRAQQLAEGHHYCGAALLS